MAISRADLMAEGESMRQNAFIDLPPKQRLSQIVPEMNINGDR